MVLALYSASPPIWDSSSTEWHIQAPQIVRSHSAILCIAVVDALYYDDQSPLGVLFRAVITGAISYMVTLLLSILTYRVAPRLHRLTRANFPGPWLLRTSKLWHVWACRTSMNHFYLDDLFRRYGDFVRTGPSEITVFHPDVFAATDGPETECSKAEWYDLLIPIGPCLRRETELFTMPAGGTGS